jgi:hypothetical protein
MVTIGLSPIRVRLLAQSTIGGNMKKTILTLWLILVLVAAAWAQEAPEAGQDASMETSATAPQAAPVEEKAPLICDAYPSSLGFSVGTSITAVSGFNLHYQRWFDDIGLAVSLGGMKGTSSSDWGTDGLVTFQYKLSDGNFDSGGIFYGALYVFANSGYVVRQYVNYAYDQNTNESVSTNVFEQYVPVGLGIGIEGVLFKHISVPMEVGFEYHILGNYMGPSFTTAIRYRF